jgi:hypothetical protein
VLQITKRQFKENLESRPLPKDSRTIHIPGV